MIASLLSFLLSFVLIAVCEALVLSSIGYRSRRYYLFYALAVNAVSVTGVMALLRYTELGRCHGYCFLNVRGLLAGFVLVVALEAVLLALTEDLSWFACLLIALGLNLLSGVVLVVAWVAALIVVQTAGIVLVSML
jgi:hypothetical protein